MTLRRPTHIARDLRIPQYRSQLARADLLTLRRPTHTACVLRPSQHRIQFAGATS